MKSRSFGSWPTRLVCPTQQRERVAATCRATGRRRTHDAREAHGARRVPAPVRPVLAGRRDPDVPRRSAAAHSRRRDGRQAHRRQDLGAATGSSHLGDSDSLFVNASTWGLMLTGRIVRPSRRRHARSARRSSRGSSAALGEPVVRAALRQAMRIMGHQFVMGRTIEKRSSVRAARATARIDYSFDMLGEAALTAADAERYLAAYATAIAAVGARRQARRLAARARRASRSSCRRCFPRYEFAQARARARRARRRSSRELAHCGARCRHRR